MLDKMGPLSDAEKEMLGPLGNLREGADTGADLQSVLAALSGDGLRKRRNVKVKWSGTDGMGLILRRGYRGKSLMKFLRGFHCIANWVNAYTLYRV